MRKYGWFGVLILWGVLLSYPWPGVPPLTDFLLYPTSALRIDYSPVSKTISLPERQGLTLNYDQRGVPHIFAQNENDLAFGMGYTQAKDRLFQLEMLRRTVRGRLSEVAGAKALPRDKWWLKFQFEKKARAAYAAMQSENPTLTAQFEAYAAGFNHYLENMAAGAKPVEFQLLGFEPTPMEPYAPIMLIRYMDQVLTYSENDLKFTALHNYLSQDLMDLYYPFTSQYAFPIYPELDSSLNVQTDTLTNSNTFRLKDNFEGADVRRSGDNELGSNNWAVAAQKSKTGHAFLCNDTHLKLALPGTWYEVHQVVNGKIIHGFTIPGSPFVVSGFTQKVAWGMTNATWDLTEFYALETNDKGQYKLDGQWEDLNPQTLSIPVKGADSVTYTYYQTHFGPADTLGGNLLATHWIADNFERNEMQAFYQLTHAQNVQEAAAALQNFGHPPQNFVLADAQGQIGMLTAGYAMLHPKPSRGITLGTQRQQKVPFTYLGQRLQVLNPPKGWNQSANHHQVTDSLAPYLNSIFAPTARGRRISEVLSDSIRLDRADLAALHGDVTDGEWPLLQEHILSTVPADLKTYFANWQGLVDTASVAATLYHVYKWNVVDSVSVSLLGTFDFRPASEEIFYRIANGMPFPLPSGDSLNISQLAPAIWQKTKKELEASLGAQPEDWTYGRYHKIYFKHVTGLAALSHPPFSAAGGPRTVNVSSGLPGTAGPSMRTLIEMNPKGVQAQTVLAVGQSGQPGHPNYTDQIGPWRRVEYFEVQLPNEPAAQSWQESIKFE
jgi:penicillin amidase